MSDIKCEVCGADAAKGADLYRVNRKGVPGIWRCIVHMTNLPDPGLREIVEIISDNYAEVMAPAGWKWNPRTTKLERAR